ncbi:tRNA lysidine(34) synthetase TilS [Phyllobacterium sp. 0TCS1.6A]|uniref:tRNA lysidine(34) synthetase TilS n=1 Tax=Phyllobacterium sp. 0TCS1.6A TaxID=2995637 RepID=UPI002264A593|nr:tRNA lysidine(34) synthetase TilS [Phyllobacterium sp. 0TCS1.6A]MCX8292971.1 tRNA lysidine(34) synthetase TilS [Phyllobacterium sp. 0TCS1.6A]
MNVPPTSADPAAAFASIDFASLNSVVVAVSGGSDSLALLYLLLDRSKREAAFPRIVAVTVDHGLRPESAAEAAYVAQLCERAGIAHRTMRWEGPKPDSALSSKAREARYRLLCEAAADLGAQAILTGHTLDDQIETYAMRLERAKEASDARGLAAMAPATLLERRYWLLRPLLGTSRETLRRYLQRAGVEWRDDPSNENVDYERVRVRNRLRGGDRAPLQRRIAEHAARRQGLGADAATLLPSLLAMEGDDLAIVSRQPAGPDPQRLATGAILAIIGGQEFLPAAAQCDRAVAFLADGEAGKKASLARCILESRRRSTAIYRELRGIPTHIVEPGATIVWDGRYRVSNGGHTPVTIMPRGRQADAAGQPSPLQRRAAASAPSLVRSDGTLVEDFASACVSVTRHLSLFDRVLSGYDVALAQSFAHILKLQAYPAPPVNQINKN